MLRSYGLKFLPSIDLTRSSRETVRPADLINASSATPVITGASISGKRLIVSGQSFDDGAKLFLNGDKQKKTENDETSPSTTLIARKSGNQIGAGQTVSLQVRNNDNTLSNEYLFSRTV